MPFPDEVTAVRLVAHRPGWSREFDELANLLAAALRGVDCAIDHVGSTSVPGLCAKDVIDVQIRSHGHDLEIGARLQDAGFRRRPEPWNDLEHTLGHVTRKAVFAPGPGARPANIHLRPADGISTRYALLFRDYLRANETAGAAWGELKRAAAAARPDLEGYGQLKQPAWEAMMVGADWWASATGWRTPAGDVTVTSARS